MTLAPPIRVLHVLGGMNRGGVETWLMHVLRHIDRRRFRIDFLVHTRRPCAYDDEIRALGSGIIPCLKPSRPWRYARNLRRILREDGPYDAVHSHVHHYSGLVLRAARAAAVPQRIAHSHNDTAAVDAAAGWLRRGYLRLCSRWIGRHATARLACSPQAAAALYGGDWQDDPRNSVLPYGIDFAPFRAPVDRAAVRAELGIPPEAFVVGHVGRFVEQKNHAFLIEIAAEIARQRPDAVLLLVGDGPLRAAVERQVQRLGLSGRVVFAGVRADVPRLMRGAMDAFVFPSRFEGLGLVAVEAQAAGLPCFLSTAVPPEADGVPSLVRRLDLAEPPARWADAMLHRRDARLPIAPSAALRVVEQSRFNIRACVARLEALYDGAALRRRAA